MLLKFAWLLLCVLPLVALCAEDYYKVIMESPTQLLNQC
jgi:DnaJ-related protein SCJ1